MRLLLSSLAPFLRKYRWPILAGFGFIVLSNLFKIFPAQLVREAFNVVTELLKDYDAAGTNAAKAVVREQIFWEIAEYSGLLLLMAFLSGLFLFLVRQMIIVCSRKIEYDQKNQLFQHYQTYSQQVMRRRRTGDLMARIAEDVGAVRMFTGPGLMYTANTITLFAMVMITMLTVNAELALYVLMPLPLLSLLIYLVHSVIIKRQTEKQNQLSAMSSFVQDTYSGIRLLRAYAREQRFEQAFVAQSDEYRRKSLDLVRVDALFFPLIVVLIGLSTVFTVWIGGHKVIAGELTVGNIAEFILYVNLLMWPVASLGWVTSLINKAAASQQRINELLSIRSELSFPESSPPVKHGRLEAKRLSYTYPDTGIHALRDVGFELPAGSVLGVMGRTGSGKTTLANLLLRLMDPDTGEIRLDGQPLPAYSATALRTAVGYVPQDGFLFSDTIRNNIAFGRPEASKEEIEEAARFAGVLEDIQRFPEGFETRVGERGVTLSGGQQQRLAIARAFLQRPQLLILDDALSAVDTGTEERILRNLRDPAFLGGEPPTLVIFAHRLSAICRADEVLVLEAGRVAERGTHSELMAHAGRYAAVFQQQQLADEAEPLDA